MNSYEFTARRQRNGVVITGRLGGDPLPGVPDLESLPSGTSGVLVYRLVFRPATQHRATAFDVLIPETGEGLRMIRILLPDFQEFILRSRSARAPYHPVRRVLTDYCSQGAAR